MRLDRLTKAQVKKVYQERMKEDFPPNELKPFAMINKAVGQGIVHTAEEIKDLYKMHYKALLLGVIYKKCIIV